MNKSMGLSVVVLLLVGVGVSRLKYEVVFLRKKLQSLNHETEQCLDNIKILEAEWSYLNNPERLKKLAEKYLPDMKPIGVKQFTSYNKIIHGELIATERESTTQKSEVKAEKPKQVMPKKSALDSFLSQAIVGG